MALCCRARPARGPGKLQKVALQEFRVSRVGITRQKNAAKAFPCAKNFPTTSAPPSCVRSREVEQLERSLDGGLASIGPPRGLRAQRALDLTADVGQLLDDRQARPAATRERRMHGRHQVSTSASTMRTISPRVTGSSTVRDRLPRAGRTLINESNSIQSLAGSPGYRLIPQRSL
jgi:hypothetical protein